MEGAEAAVARAGGEAAGGLRGRRLAGEVDIDAEAAELEAEVEGGLGRPGPLSVAEEMKDAHGRPIIADGATPAQ